MTHTFTLTQRREIAEDTTAFTLTPPSGFSFKAGQFCEWKLEELVKQGEKGSTRYLSMASAPHEEKVVLATRMTGSAFKDTLAQETPPLEIRADGPMGTFTLHDDTDRTAVFLVGGIGITPVRSMIRDSLHKDTGHGLVLLYANDTIDSAAWHDSFTLRAKRNETLTYIPALTEPPEAWSGEEGRIDEEMIARYAPIKSAVFYVVGPPGFVYAMQDALDELGVDDLRVKAEDFAGY